jgi:O-antigen/teichoic acid export membrane protein
VARRLTIVNLTIMLAAIVTSPLLARALGPAGRGELAAVTVVATLVGSLGDFGLSAFVLRESSRGTPVRRLIGSIVPLMMAIGICWAAAGPVVARLVAGNRQTVYWLLLVLLLLTPVAMLTSATSAILWGHQRWRLFTVQRLAVPVGSAAVYGFLFVAGYLTVETAGITFAVLSVVSTLPSLVVLRGAGRPQWSTTLARRGGMFGSTIWLAALANLTNARLDQLLMTRLVSPAQLGLYVTAVNVSLMEIALTSAVSQALLPRVASGEKHLAARALRVLVALTALLSAALILTAPVLLPLVFGTQFSGAVVTCQILALAAIPFGASQIMATVLFGLGLPGIAARAELISVGVTVPALLLFVGRYGGEGAAVISLVAYSCTAAYLAVRLRPHLESSWSAMFLMRSSDFDALRTLPVIRTFTR